MTPSNTPSLPDPFLLMFKNMSGKTIVHICRIFWHHFVSLFLINGIICPGHSVIYDPDGIEIVRSHEGKEQMISTAIAQDRLYYEKG